MSDDGFEIPRRKALGALGTIGVASAGAGLGTSAYFSDEETYENNQLTAGTLDMVVDWEEHYSDWMGEELDYARMPEEGEEPDFSLPAPEDDPNARPIELVFTETQQDFWDATAIEAYPDENQDALRDPISDPCRDLGSLDEVLSDERRTNNEYTSPGDPLISLEDVKPGDFGEVTLSFSLCENPGYVWFGGELLTNVDGENTEPEIEDPDEPQNASEIGPDTPGELAEEIQIRAWYDDCDNIYEPGAVDSCVYHLFDNSGTMEQNLATETGTADKADMAARIAGNSDDSDGLTEYLDTIDSGGDDGTLASAPTSVGFMGTDTENPDDPGDTVEPVVNSTNEDDIIAAIDQQVGDSSGGGIAAADIVGGLESAQTALTDCENENKVLILYANGDTRPGDEADRQDVYDAAAAVKDAGITIKIVGFDVDNDSPAEDFLETVGDELYTVQPSLTEDEVEDDADAVANEIKEQFDTTTSGEEQFFQGPLTDFLDRFTFDPENGELGFPLDGDIPAEEGGGMSQRNCFSANMTHCIGFEWWLPLDHANEVQGDIVEFNLGFYTEQCRHNNGAGLPPENNTNNTSA